MDAIDEKILRELVADGRLTNAELAQRIALSPSACLRRVQELERLGVIKGYRAVLDPARLGVGFVAYVAIGLSRHTLDEQRGFEAGGVDYITKPVSPPLVQARVVTHLKLHAHERQLTALVKARTRELEATRLEIIRRLGRAAEFKDDETGQHVIRMSHYARLLAEDEWKVMRKHPAIGAGIIGRHDHPLLHTARIVALTHHEKWDGTGYPRGLAGDKIPLTGRIVAIADVFDALTSERPYKEAWPVARAVDYLRSNAGSHFDPTLVELFIGRLDDVMKVRAMYVDQPGAATLESYAADVAL